MATPCVFLRCSVLQNMSGVGGCLLSFNPLINEALITNFSCMICAVLLLLLILYIGNGYSFFPHRIFLVCLMLEELFYSW